MITDQDLLNEIARVLHTRVEDIPAGLTDKELDKAMSWAEGTSSVKRSRGTLPIPSYLAGRSRRTPVSAVIEFKLKQLREGGLG